MVKTISCLNTAAENFDIAYADKSVSDDEIALIVKANQDRAKNSKEAGAAGRTLYEAAKADFFEANFKIEQDYMRSSATCAENHFPTGEGLDPKALPSCQAYNKAITKMQIAAVLVATENPQARLTLGIDTVKATDAAPQSWRMSHGY